MSDTIVVKMLPRSTVEDFARANRLRVVVKERHPREGEANRFYAQIENAEIMDGSMLRGTYGDGATPDEAIAAYAREISRKRLAINAMSPERREVEAPVLTHESNREDVKGTQDTNAPTPESPNPSP
jgi:hypothetical protein